MELSNTLPSILDCLLKLKLGGQGTINCRNDYRSKSGGGGVCVCVCVCVKEKGTKYDL